MKGKIKYLLWTILGEKEIEISYGIVMKGKFARCKIHITGEGDKPDELETPETMQEIIELCMKDMEKKSMKTTYKRVLPDSLWGAN